MTCAGRGARTPSPSPGKVQGGLRADDGDIYIEALNHPAGDLTQFWTHTISHDWSQDTDNWNGLPENLRAQVDTIVNSPDRNGQLRQVTLARWLRFYYGADADWTRAHLSPLFDWAEHPDEAFAIWQTFLAHGQFDDRLLEAGLLDGYLAACTHTEELGSGAHRPARGAWPQSRSGPLSTPGIGSPTSPRQPQTSCWRSGPRTLQSACAAYRPMRAPSNGIVGFATTGQSASLPFRARLLHPTESAQMARWVLGLRSHRSEATELTRKMPAALTGDAQLLYELHEEDLTENAAAWNELLTHCLSNTGASVAVGHYLPDIVSSLKGAAPDLDLAPLIEQAMRLGCHDAGTW